MMLCPEDWEPSAWFRQAVRARMAQLVDEVTPETGTVTGLLGPLDLATSGAADRTCDRCGWHVPANPDEPPASFVCGAHPVDHPLMRSRILLVFGLCARCAAAERFTAEPAVTP